MSLTKSLPPRPLSVPEDRVIVQNVLVEIDSIFAVDMIGSSEGGPIDSFVIFKDDGTMHGFVFSSREDCWIPVVESDDAEKVVATVHREADRPEAIERMNRP